MHNYKTYAINIRQYKDKTKQRQKKSKKKNRNRSDLDKEASQQEPRQTSHPKTTLADYKDGRIIFEVNPILAKVQRKAKGKYFGLPSAPAPHKGKTPTPRQKVLYISKL